MKRGTPVRIARRLDDDFDILAECDEKPKQPLDRELPEIPPQHFRYVGLFDAEQAGGLDLLEAALFDE